MTFFSRYELKTAYEPGAFHFKAISYYLYGKQKTAPSKLKDEIDLVLPIEADFADTEVVFIVWRKLSGTSTREENSTIRLRQRYRESHPQYLQDASPRYTANMHIIYFECSLLQLS